MTNHKGRKGGPVGRSAHLLDASTCSPGRAYLGVLSHARPLYLARLGTKGQSFWEGCVHVQSPAGTSLAP
jgi:hypothetical protein